MKKNLPFYLVLALWIISASCNGQERSTRPLKDLKEPLESQVPYNTLAEMKIDTSFAPNAPASITRTIIVDSKGDIWIASWEGIIRYDGTSFTNMTEGISDSRFFSMMARVFKILLPKRDW